MAAGRAKDDEGETVSYTDGDLSTAIKFLIYLAAERDRSKTTASPQAGGRRRLDATFKTVVGTLLAHKKEHDAHATRVRVAFVLPSVVDLTRAWLKAGDEHIGKAARAILYYVTESDPYLKLTVSEIGILDFLRQLRVNPRRTDGYVKVRTAQFLAELCGTAKTTLLDLERVLYSGGGASGAVSTRHQAKQLWMGEEFDFVILTRHWLRCWRDTVGEHHLNRLETVLNEIEMAIQREPPASVSAGVTGLSTLGGEGPATEPFNDQMARQVLADLKTTKAT